MADNNPNNSPAIIDGAFSCVYCGTFALHKWHAPKYDNVLYEFKPCSWNRAKTGTSLSTCPSCKESLLWSNRKILNIVPDHHLPPALSPEAGPNANDLYAAAKAAKAAKNPVAAISLLRIALENLLQHISGNKSQIGLQKLIEKNKHRFNEGAVAAMELIRKAGNSAIHSNPEVDQYQNSIRKLLWLLVYVSKNIDADNRKAKEICSSFEN